MQTKFFFKQNYYGRWDLVFCLWPKNKATEFWIGWWDIPSVKETEIPKDPHQDHVDNFFLLSRHRAQRIHTRGKNSKCRIYKGIMDHLPKRLQWVHPAVFCCWDFFLLHDNVPAHKAASVCQVLTQKNVTLQIYLRQTIFCSPSWKWS